MLLAEASSSIVSVLPPVPPSTAAPYNGAQTTAQTRAALQHALDNYKPGSLSHSFQPSAADLNRSDSRSFGVTHATELSDIAAAQAVAPHSDKDTSPAVPPVSVHTDKEVTAAPLAATASQSPPSATAPVQAPTPVNPASLNNTPTQIPPASPATSPTVHSNVLHVNPQDAQNVSAPLPSVEPTIAETGVPVSAGADGPGPSSGSIHDLKLKQTPPAAAPPISAYGAGTGQAPAKFESAEDEKKRLQREERERLLSANAPPTSVPSASSTTAPAQKFETAEEEKKRLEREERERLLKEGGHGTGDGSSGQGGAGGAGAPGSEPNPPPYQDF